jgi:four helix bundle protein
MAKGDDIQERLVRLAVDLVKICDQLPETRAAVHIASQLLRSGTSPAPNYAEARGAESDKDFVHKLKVVLKELNESLVWLAIIQEGEMLPKGTVDRVREECTALCRITAASIKTVKARCGAETRNPGQGQGVSRSSKDAQAD